MPGTFTPVSSINDGKRWVGIEGGRRISGCAHTGKEMSVFFVSGRNS